MAIEINIDASSKENTSNKQNDLTTDGTGVKFPTVDAVKTHTDNTSNPHGVTKSQVGLSNVDNTSDANKPISTAAQAALDDKQDNLINANRVIVNPGLFTLGAGDGSVFISYFSNSALRNKLTGDQMLRTIIGGYDSDIVGGAGSQGLACVIFGSHHSIINGGSANHCTIAGGSYLQILAGAYSTNVGGTQNVISGNANNGTGQFAGNNCTVSGSGAIGLGGGANLVSGNTSSNTGGQGNTVSGNLSSNTGGQGNVVSGANSGNINGLNNNLSGNYSGIFSGLTNSNGGTYSFIASGRENVIATGAEYCSISSAYKSTIAANCKYTRVSGLEVAATNLGADYLSNGKFTTIGDAQTFTVPLKIISTDATAKTLRPSDFVKLVIPSNKCWIVRSLVIATDGTDTASFEVRGCVRNNGGTTSIIGTPTITALFSSAGASTWTMTFNLSSDEVRVNGVGQAGKTIRWTSRTEVSEVGF